MFNPHLNHWHNWLGPTEPPALNVPLFILVEHDTIDDQNVLLNQPFVRLASLHRYDPDPRTPGVAYYWKLLDYDPEEEEEILRQNFSVVSWRYATKGGR